MAECLMLFKTYFLECSFKISDEHPHHFNMGHYNLEQYRGRVILFTSQFTNLSYELSPAIWEIPLR